VFRRAAAAVLLFLLVPATTAQATEGWRTVEAHGVALRAAPEWARVAPADDGRVTDPRTLLVVGTKGARPVESDCQVASYRVPEEGAVVVVIGWKAKPAFSVLSGREALTWRALRPGYFECFEGRGIASQITLADHVYQVSVMVGTRAPKAVVREAMVAARSLTAVG
jgi:hypothetical protein